MGKNVLKQDEERRNLQIAHIHAQKQSITFLHLHCFAAVADAAELSSTPKVHFTHLLKAQVHQVVSALLAAGKVFLTRHIISAVWTCLSRSSPLNDAMRVKEMPAHRLEGCFDIKANAAFLRAVKVSGELSPCGCIIYSSRDLFQTANVLVGFLNLL